MNRKKPDPERIDEDNQTKVDVEIAPTTTTSLPSPQKHVSNSRFAL
jgi:hypothetical protein